MNEGAFVPSEELVRQYKKETIEYTIDKIGAERLIEETRAFISSMNIPDEVFSESISEEFVSAIDDYISIAQMYLHRCSGAITSISINGKFSQSFLELLAPKLWVDESNKDFYQKLHEEFFQYIGEGKKPNKYYELIFNPKLKGIDLHILQEFIFPKFGPIS